MFIFGFSFLHSLSLNISTLYSYAIALFGLKMEKFWIQMVAAEISHVFLKKEVLILSLIQLL